MKTKFFIIIALVIVGVGGWWYMKIFCIGLFGKQEVIALVQDETGMHEISRPVCRPFYKTGPLDNSEWIEWQNN